MEFGPLRQGSESQDSDEPAPPGTMKFEDKRARSPVVSTPATKVSSKSAMNANKRVENAKKKLRAFSIQKKTAIAPIPQVKPVGTGNTTVLIGRLSAVKTTPKPEKVDDEQKKLPRPPKPGGSKKQSCNEQYTSYTELQKKTLSEIEDMKRKMELVELGIPLGLICPSTNALPVKAMPTKAMPPIKTFLDSAKVDEIIREAKKAKAEGKEFKFDYQKFVPDYDNPFQRKKDYPEMSQETKDTPERKEEEPRRSKGDRDTDTRKSDRYDKKYDAKMDDRYKNREVFDRPRKEENRSRDREDKRRDRENRSKDRTDISKDREERYRDKEERSRDKERVREKDEKQKKSETGEVRIEKVDDKKDSKKERDKASKKSLEKDSKEANVNLNDFLVCDSWSLEADDKNTNSPQTEKSKKAVKSSYIDPLEQKRHSLGQQAKFSPKTDSPKPKVEKLKPVMDSFEYEIDPNEDDVLDIFDENSEIEKFSTKTKSRKESLYDSPVRYKYDYERDASNDAINDDTFLESVINEIKLENISDDEHHDKSLVEYDESPLKDSNEPSVGSVTPEMDERVRLQSQRSDYSDGYRSTDSRKSFESGYKSSESGFKSIDGFEALDITYKSGSRDKSYKDIATDYKSSDKNYKTSENSYKSSDASYKYDKSYQSSSHSYKSSDSRKSDSSYKSDKNYKMSDTAYKSDKRFPSSDHSYKSGDPHKSDSSYKSSDKNYKSSDITYKSDNSYQSSENSFKSSENSYKSGDAQKSTTYRSKGKSTKELRLSEEKVIDDDDEMNTKLSRNTIDSLETWSFVLKICQPLLFRHDKDKCYKSTHTMPKMWYAQNPKLCSCVKDRSVVYEELEMCKMGLVDRLYGCDQITDSPTLVARTWYPRSEQCVVDTPITTVNMTTEWDIEDPPKQTPRLPMTPQRNDDESLDREYQRFMEAVSWQDIAESKQDSRSTTPVRLDSRKKKIDREEGEDREEKKKAKKVKLNNDSWSQESEVEEEKVKPAKSEKVREKRKRRHSPSTQTSEQSSDDADKKRKKSNKKKENKKAKAKATKRRRMEKKMLKKLKEAKKDKKKKKEPVEEESDFEEEEKEVKKKKKKVKKKKLKVKTKKAEKKKRVESTSSSSSASGSDSSDESDSESERRATKKKKNVAAKKKKEKKKKKRQLSLSPAQFDVNVLNNMKQERSEPRHIIDVKELHQDFSHHVHVKQEAEEEAKKQERLEKQRLQELQELEEQKKKIKEAIIEATPEPVSEPVAKVSEPVAKVAESVAKVSEPAKVVAKTSEPEVKVTKVTEPVAKVAEPVAKVTEPMAKVTKPEAQVAKTVAKVVPVANVVEPVTQKAEPKSIEPVKNSEADLMNRFDLGDDMIFSQDKGKIEFNKEANIPTPPRADEASQCSSQESTTSIKEVSEPSVYEKDESHLRPCSQNSNYSFPSVLASEPALYKGGQDEQYGTYELYERLAMAYQSDVASQLSEKSSGGDSATGAGWQRIETVVRARAPGGGATGGRGEIKCDWKAGEPPPAPARPSRWGLKPGDVNIVLTGGESTEAPEAPEAPDAVDSGPQPVYQIQSLANRTDNSMGYDEAYMDMYGASDRLQYGDCFAPHALAGQTAKRTVSRSLDDRIHQALRNTVLGEVAKDENAGKETPEKGILMTKPATPGKRVSFADGYKPGQDSDNEEPPLRKRKKPRRVGCAWPCPASHPDHVPLWDALPPPPPPPGDPPPLVTAPLTAPAAPPQLRLLRHPPRVHHKFDPNVSIPNFMPPEPPPGLISFS